MTISASEIPRVDLGDLSSENPKRRATFDATLREGFQHFGFVRVAGHGISPERIAAVYAAFEAFFALDDAEKAKVASAAGGQRGFTPFGIEHAKDQAAPDLKEFFHIGRELPPGHPLERVYPQNVWPEHPPELRSAGLALYADLDACAGQLLASLERSFELETGTFSEMLVDGNSILRALHYPPHASDATGLRAAPHEDINLITLLCDATESGLEIQLRDESWLAVPALAGEIVADAGDMLSRVTNDVIPSTVHRVVTPPGSETQHRYALPYFAHPYPDCDLSVLPQFVEARTQPRHAPITAAAFLEERLREIGLYDEPVD